jgi:hypothetical protein
MAKGASLPAKVEAKMKIIVDGLEFPADAQCQVREYYQTDIERLGSRRLFGIALID